MASTAPRKAPVSDNPEQRATIDDWFSMPEDMGAELLNGRIVFKGAPGPTHDRAQMSLTELLRGSYHRRTTSKDKPGGWWIAVETDMDLGDLGCRPDVLGWRRDKHPAMPAPATPELVTTAPTWICEILSPATALFDLGEKRVGYHRAGVLHYWLLDPTNGTLTVLQWTADGYLIVLVGGRGEKVRAAPFMEIEIDIGALFGEGEAKVPAASPSKRQRPPVIRESNE